MKDGSVNDDSRKGNISKGTIIMAYNLYQMSWLK